MTAKYIKLKVHLNKKNNQMIVNLPRKKFEDIPEFIMVKKSKKRRFY